jgi:DNA replication protein DnaC
MESINKVIQRMQEHGMKAPEHKVFLKLQNADAIVRYYLKQFIRIEGKECVWLPEYNHIVSWLQNNEGRGLLLYGNCGRGKTVMAQYVIPAIILSCFDKVMSTYNAQEMNSKLDEVLRKKLLCIDDIGVEDMLNTFGTKRLSFLEVVDTAEKKGNLLIITTNLNDTQLVEKYGERAMDRIMATMKRVLFTGNSLRK